MAQTHDSQWVVQHHHSHLGMCQKCESSGPTQNYLIRNSGSVAQHSVSPQDLQMVRHEEVCRGKEHELWSQTSSARILTLSLTTAVQLWASCLISLCIGFPICKMDTIIVLPFKNCQKVEISVDTQNSTWHIIRAQ